MTLGEGLKRFREKFGLSQAQVAKDIGLQSPQYRRYEWDKAKPSTDFIYKMTSKYGVSADYLLGLSDEPHPVHYDENEIQEAFKIRDIFRSSMAQVATQVKSGTGIP